MNQRKNKTMGNRFNAARYDRPGGRCAFVWPTRKITKTALKRLGDTVKRVANDIYVSRRDNNHVRRAADRPAVRAAVAEARGRGCERMTAQRHGSRASRTSAQYGRPRGRHPYKPQWSGNRPERTTEAAATPQDFVSRLPRRSAQARRRTPRP